MRRLFAQNKIWPLIAIICTVFIVLIMLTARTEFVDAPEIKIIDFSFDAVKVGPRRDIIETVQIHVTGKYQSDRSQEGVLELDIEDFDAFTNIRMREKNNFVCFAEQQRGCAYFETERSDRTYTETLRMYFSGNFDCVVLEGRGEILYIGSGSGKYTPQECISYFENDEEAWDFAESVNIDKTIDAVRMNERGREIETVQLDITGYYQDYLFKKDSIGLAITPSKNSLSSLETGNGAPMYWNELKRQNLTFIQILVCGHNSATQVSEILIFMTTDEYDRFIIAGESMGFFYVGSISGSYTAQEIVTYFNAFVDTGITLPE